MGKESFGKMEKNQALRTSGIISVLSLVAVVAVMVLWPWSLDTKSIELVRAKQKAEVIAYQIVQIYKEAQVDVPQVQPEISQKRGLASVKASPAISAGGVLREFKNQGLMGVDPWGQSFQYRIINFEAGPRLLVWSAGPNGVLDNQDFLSEDPHEALALPKAGDDVRVVLSIRGNVSK
jgi:type II secretory pathway pseudopilin PulG